jgi:class 3 adenylate cyclase
MYDPRTMTDAAVTAGDPAADPLSAGRAALARHAWTEAFDRFKEAEGIAPLSGPDLESYGQAAFFAGHGDERVDIKERAYAAYLAEGDAVRAGYFAADLANEQGMRGRMSIASAWARRAEGLLAELPETYAHGYLSLVRSDMARAQGDLAQAERHAAEAVEIGRRSGDPDLKAMGLTTLGTVKIGAGSATDGIALLEEAAISAVSGELTPITAGITSCQMISACRDLTDYQRAQEWLEATDKWCRSQEVSGFPGICRVHRAEIVALQGGWDRAEDELRRATTELKAYAAIPPMADGLYAIGEIRRLKGDSAGAEEALREAHALGRSPQPALALLRLGAGQVKSAQAAIDAALRESNWDQWARARLLAAKVEIAVAAGDVDPARAAADELATITSGYDSPALRAGTHEASGRVRLAEGDPSSAVDDLRAAVRLWREVGAAYDIARVRLALSRALRGAGDPEDADLELRAARDEFARLGAQPDLEKADRELQAAAERSAATEQVRRTFVFTDIVGSTRLAEELGNDAWERVLRWHDDVLRDAFARHGGTVVNSTGDGFFVAFGTAAAAIRSAIEIQRALAERRDEDPATPSVRIGVHTADAVMRGSDYSGIGVHVASRLGDLAEGDRVLVSADALAEAPDVAVANARELTVRGVSAPIRVADVDWR